jgi:hypothetical protein
VDHQILLPLFEASSLRKGFEREDMVIPILLLLMAFLALLALLAFAIACLLHYLFFFFAVSGHHLLPPGSMGWPYVGETLAIYSQGPGSFFVSKQRRYLSQSCDRIRLGCIGLDWIGLGWVGFRFGRGLD